MTQSTRRVTCLMSPVAAHLCADPSVYRNAMPTPADAKDLGDAECSASGRRGGEATQRLVLPCNKPALDLCATSHAGSILEWRQTGPLTSGLGRVGHYPRDAGKFCNLFPSLPPSLVLCPDWKVYSYALIYVSYFIFISCAYAYKESVLFKLL